MFSLSRLVKRALVLIPLGFVILIFLWSHGSKENGAVLKRENVRHSEPVDTVNSISDLSRRPNRQKTGFHSPAQIAIHPETLPQKHDELTLSKLKNKTLLFWDWNWNPLESKFYDLMEVRHCPVKACKLTKDRSLVKQADVVFFLNGQSTPKTGPTYRHPSQRWVWVEGESPCHSRRLDKSWDGLFNWTMVYRADADVLLPYTEIAKRDTPIKKDYLSVTKSKRKLVAWMVSNCKTPSRRMDFVKELQKYIEVDIYGACGPLKCQRSGSWGWDTTCLDLLARDYKFYLAFENSISLDYVTEKFYKTVNIDIVAVTRGNTDYTRAGIRPEWHINTDDFNSPKELAEYLHMLDKNPEKYVKYLEWKNEYRQLPDRAFCHLCERLHFQKEPPKSYSWDELNAFFWKDHCLPPTDI
ncbi:glycoprotein 3-alpha-L-fucosyltransferase A-like isoform X2 [Lingula anatina]|uniref:Fucosyltransferase n=1 Tax=Lingula anatina TaxID=7574 RepID=A0A1S3I2F5_LINAN|nr:glycoprotein 3-alpha-L-fucosyltransferase A-like isoform X2 [Lingula anatina]|eukprot:XP_013392452.1 glycoprotein 3-alpha-L-fucosyltransferase A-like isoform X2 [Lingula anatina]